MKWYRRRKYRTELAAKGEEDSMDEDDCMGEEEESSIEEEC
jgi:hypothetical protein